MMRLVLNTCCNCSSRIAYLPSLGSFKFLSLITAQSCFTTWFLGISSLPTTAASGPDNLRSFKYPDFFLGLPSSSVLGVLFFTGFAGIFTARRRPLPSSSSSLRASASSEKSSPLSAEPLLFETTFFFLGGGGEDSSSLLLWSSLLSLSSLLSSSSVALDFSSTSCITMLSIAFFRSDMSSPYFSSNAFRTFFTDNSDRFTPSKISPMSARRVSSEMEAIIHTSSPSETTTLNLSKDEVMR